MDVGGIGIIEAPGKSGVGGFENAKAAGMAVHRIARTCKKDIGIIGVDGNGSESDDGEAIGIGSPGCPVVSGFPDAAGGRGHINDIGIAGVNGDAVDPSDSPAGGWAVGANHGPIRGDGGGFVFGIGGHPRLPFVPGLGKWLNFSIGSYQPFRLVFPPPERFESLAFFVGPLAPPTVECMAGFPNGYILVVFEANPIRILSK